VPAAEVSGLTVVDTGELAGTVLAEDGKPLAGVPVYLVPARGPQREVRTDAQGRYRAVLPAGSAPTLVFVKGRARVGGAISVPTRTEYGEAIEVRDTVPPAVMPRLVDRPRLPAYSERLKDRNAWARAWLMLEVDERGAVARAKLLHAPGHDMDQTAIAAAFALRFEPARDRADRPMRAVVLWTFEWPAFWWMHERGHTLAYLPAEVDRIPCRGARGMAAIYRDCTTVDLTTSLALPWIDRPAPGRRSPPPAPPAPPAR
jgi:hypothetical protein